MAINEVLVVGLGLMGRGILQVCAQAGFVSYGYDVSEEAVKNATGFIENTLPATPLASVTKRPDRFIIIQFHQPPTVMRLVEVVRAIQTSDETAAIAKEFCKAIDKDAVEIKVDCPGFLTNRTMIPLMNEVIYCLYEGVSTKEDID